MLIRTGKLGVIRQISTGAVTVRPNPAATGPDLGGQSDWALPRLTATWNSPAGVCHHVATAGVQPQLALRARDASAP